MTVARVLMAAFCALAAGVAVENAKATSPCSAAGADAKACAVQIVAAGDARPQ